MVRSFSAVVELSSSRSLSLPKGYLESFLTVQFVILTWSFYSGRRMLNSNVSFIIFFFRVLNLNSPLQLGGVSSTNLLYPKLSVTSYKGCIRNVISQGTYYDLKTPSHSNGTKEGCPMVDQHCRGHQCDSLSKCVPSWTGYSCSCPFGFSGPTCGQSKSESRSVRK